MSKTHLNKRYRLILRWTAICFLGTAVTTLGLILFRRPDRNAVEAAHGDVDGLTSILSKTVSKGEIPFQFQDDTEALGLDFVHFPARRQSLLPEDMGSGIACGDFDQDGFVDLFMVNFAGSVQQGTVLNPDQGRCRLYRNVSGQKFEDVTAAAGIDLIAYAMGAAWGDYDNDGFPDLYVTSFGENFLFRNQGNGTFRDMTREAKVADARFGAGCSWGDFDRDGHIDLYVCNYVDFQVTEGSKEGVALQYDTEQPFTLNPSSYSAQRNALFHNLGDGTFEEIGEVSGVVDPQARSLSASWVDLDGDGWSDIYVANDVSKNNVYLNLKNGQFRDVGASSLAADYRGAMGLAIGDFDNDLDQDMLVSHWIAQENALYQNMTTTQVGDSKLRQKKLWFVDVADQFGLGQDSLDLTGWATGFADFDNDGRKDLWVVNGSTFEERTDHSKLRPEKFRLYWNRGEEGFVNVADALSDDLPKPIVGRGGAQLDYNRDGRMDFVILAHGERARIFSNHSPEIGNWLRIKLTQRGGNTAALGGKVYVTTKDSSQMSEVGASSSYLSQDEQTLHFGLGLGNNPAQVKIVWPDGTEEIHEQVALNREYEYIHDL